MNQTIHVNILIVTLYSNFKKCYPWSKQDKAYKEPFCYFLQLQCELTIISIKVFNLKSVTE